MQPVKMDTKRKTVNLPFGEFMAYLRRQGFIIGVDHYLGLQALLNKLGPDCRPADLKYVLCPIFASSEKQQNQFYRAFDSYFQPMETAGIKKIIPGDEPESKDVELTGEPVGTPGWKYVLLGVLLLVLAALVIYRLGSGREITPRTGTAQKTIPSSTEIDKGKQQGQDSRTGDREMGKTQAGGLDKFQYKPGFFELYGYIIRGVGGLAPLIILILLEFYKYNRRRLILLKQRGKKPPFVWPVKVETPETGLVKNEQFYQAARLLRRRLKSDVMRLDVAKTLSRTIEKAGFPQLEYKSLTRPPEYLILIDLPAYRDHHAHLFDTLVKALETEGLFVTRYFYESDPRVCFKGPDQQRVYLSDLKARYSDHRLIVFGDGEEWLDPVSGRLDKWTGLFTTWKERAVLTPVPAQEWGLKEIVLAKEFIVLPASLEGLGALVDHFSTRTGYDPEARKQAGPRERTLPPDVYHDTGELRNNLGEELFQWLCACAVYPELHWDLTLYLGSLPCMPEDLIREENLLRLIRLPWFRTGSMPDELRWALIGELDIDKSKVIRTAVIELLEKNPAPRESFAFDSYRLNLVVQRWMLSRKERRKRKEVLKSLRTIDDKRIVQDYTLLRFLESAPRSPLHFVLPKRIRKLFYRKGVPFFGLRIGIRAALAIIIAAAVLLFLKPIKTLYINEKGFWEANYGDGIIMVHIPAGEFTMGSNDYDDEKPLHTIYLDGYWIGKYEVTFAQYDKYCEDVKKAKPDDEGWGRGKRPVINVSWDDAKAYCDWLSTEKNLTFKLPTEAQWEKAARGTASIKYPWGDNEPYYKGKWYANYAAHDSWEKRGEDGFEFTAPVGSYPQGASPYGLLDMAGNVWEWCYDLYGDDYYKNSPKENPTGPESGSLRVVRGGGWADDARGLRCAYRLFDGPSFRDSNPGFRLCQDNR
jgi:formylglycine-generating enzyme required for sulfatase activity